MITLYNTGTVNSLIIKEDQNVIILYRSSANKYFINLQPDVIKLTGMLDEYSNDHDKQTKI